jgi:putative transposase
MLFLALCCITHFALRLFNGCRRHKKSRRYYTRRHITLLLSANVGKRKKPDWIKQALLTLHSKTGLSHRKLAQLFNQLYFAQTGYSVGRTFVRELLMQAEYETMQHHRQFRHHVPRHSPMLTIWAVDTSTVTDASQRQNTIFGIVDHGTRLNVALRFVKRFNSWTFLGYLFLAIGTYGKPAAIKTDNHAVFHSALVRCVLAYCNIKQRYSPSGMPWLNGRIERFFGTFKSALKGFLIQDQVHLMNALISFQFWYNNSSPPTFRGANTDTGVDWH